jgi:tetratricopeptide (TPR) repeat protein
VVNESDLHPKSKILLLSQRYRAGTKTNVWALSPSGNDSSQSKRRQWFLSKPETDANVVKPSVLYTQQAALSTRDQKTMSDLNETIRRLQEMGLADLNDELMNNMDTLKLIHQASKQQSKPKEYSATLLSPVIIRQLYMQGYEEAVKGNALKGDAISAFTTAKSALVHGPAPPLDTLRPTTMKEVAKRVNYIHNDRVLFLKTMYQAYTRVGTMVLVEDDSGDCLPFSLYNFVQTNQDIDELLPMGTKLALLAPYMKNMQDDRKNPLMLRCDNPQCIVRYDTESAWEAAKAGKPAPAEDMNPAALKQLGNDAFRRKKYELAVRFYSRALSCGSIGLEDKIACLSNRAQGSLKMKRWEQAASDAQNALSLDSSHVKAKYRLAKAMKGGCSTWNSERAARR